VRVCPRAGSRGEPAARPRVNGGPYSVAGGGGGGTVGTVVGPGDGVGGGGSGLGVGGTIGTVVGPRRSGVGPLRSGASGVSIR